MSESVPLEEYAILHIYVDEADEELVQKYEDHVEQHNHKVISSQYPDSGFDLFIPEDVSFDEAFKTKMVDTKIKCEMQFLQCGMSHPQVCGYYVYPRSSMSKTPLMLANHVGIIDSGYRGNIKAAFRFLPSQPEYTAEKHQRLLQICHPSLCPIIVKIVSEDRLSTTSRGDGGFGSTGK